MYTKYLYNRHCIPMINSSSYDFPSLVIIVVSIYHLSIGARFTETYS